MLCALGSLSENIPMSAYTYLIKLGYCNGVTTTLNLVLVFVVTLVLYVYFRFYKYDEKFMKMANKIPGPRVFPVIGSAYIFGTNPKDILQDVSIFSAKFGDVSGYWIGPMFYVCIHKAYDLEMVLGNNNMLRKTIANDLMKSALGDGILGSHGDKWKKHRKLLQPTFHYKILEDYVGVFISKSEILNGLLEAQIDKTDFDIYPFTCNYSYDILHETLLTKKSDEQLTGKLATYVEALTICASIVTCRFFKPWMYIDYVFYKTPSGRIFKTNINYLHNIARQVISKKKEQIEEDKAKSSVTYEEDGKKKRKGYLDHLLDIAPENDLTDEDVLDETNTIMMTGYDTTSSALGFLCIILSKRFDIQEKILDEVREVTGTLEEKPFTYQDIQSFKYLDRVIRESLRTLPTIPYVARQITEDTPLPSGYTLPEGCGVIIPFIRLHRDPELYPNPNVFDPDNFLPERVAARHSFAFLPFSAGPRNCIGQKYAMVQLKTFVVCLLRRFWLTPTDNTLELASKITMISRTGIRVGLKKRTLERPVIHNIENLSKCVKTNIEFMDVYFKDSYV